MSTKTTKRDAADAAIATAITSYVAAERDDRKRGTACRDLFAVTETYARHGLPAAQAWDDLSVAAEVQSSGRHALKAATARAHVAAWKATTEHYQGRDAVTVAGATYVARQSNREGGAKAVAAILASAKDAATIVAALDAMPRASKSAGKGDGQQRPLNADAVVEYLARVAAQEWEGEDVKQVLAALAKAGTAVQARMPKTATK